MVSSHPRIRAPSPGGAAAQNGRSDAATSAGRGRLVAVGHGTVAVVLGGDVKETGPAARDRGAPVVVMAVLLGLLMMMMSVAPNEDLSLVNDGVVLVRRLGRLRLRPLRGQVLHKVVVIVAHDGPGDGDAPSPVIFDGLGTASLLEVDGQDGEEEKDENCDDQSQHEEGGTCQQRVLLALGDGVTGGPGGLGHRESPRLSVHHLAKVLSDEIDLDVIPEIDAQSGNDPRPVNGRVVLFKKPAVGLVGPPGKPECSEA